MTKKESKSAADFLAELNADPDHVTRRQAQEDLRMLREAEIRTITQPLLDQLAATGYPVASLDVLAKKYAPLPAPVVGVLLDWLPQSHDEAIQEQVVRALGTSVVPFNGKPLVLLFRTTDSDALRYAIANTMAQAPVRGVGPWILEAVQNPRYGIARQMLALAAVRHNSGSVANSILASLIDQLPGHVALALAESGQQRELELLENAYKSASGWVKQEIGRAISVIRRRLTEAKR